MNRSILLHLYVPYFLKSQTAWLHRALLHLFPGYIPPGAPRVPPGCLSWGPPPFPLVFFTAYVSPGKGMLPPCDPCADAFGAAFTPFFFCRIRQNHGCFFVRFLLPQSLVQALQVCYHVRTGHRLVVSRVFRKLVCRLREK